MSQDALFGDTADDGKCPNDPPCSHGFHYHTNIRGQTPRCTFQGCPCGEPLELVAQDTTPTITSQDKHHVRMHTRAIKALIGVGFTLPQAQRALDALAAESTDFCVSCGYKRKGATGSGGGVGLAQIDGIEAVVRNRQRDGDAGDLAIRESHAVKVIRYLYWSDGLTDEELANNSGIFHDSAKGARANLVTAGWVQASDQPKRESVNGRPMTVWELTPGARARMTELRAS